MIRAGIPEIFEDELHPVTDARTDTLQSLRELGPPDLVHLVKQSTKSSSRQLGVYHHVTGVDASTSASLAAYINTLTYANQDKAYRVVSGLYCCYNAFSRLDMRVQVQIPGTVESYCVTERGDKLEATEQHWLETYLCSVLRAYSYADNGQGDAMKKIVGVRRFNPITNMETEHRFLDAAERLFFNGWQLGSDPEIQVPNLVSNHLATGILAYVKTTGRYAPGINLLEKLREKDVEVSSLLASIYIIANEEVKAVQLLHQAIEELPMDYSLLDCQADFVKSKGRGDLALEIAKRAVVAAPSEFGTWARLTEVYVSLDRWDLALLTLNSCPMFTYLDKDAPRLPEPTRILLPLNPETVFPDIDDTNHTGDTSVHPSLRKLSAANYKGTFQKAYALLTEITKKIGWDQLLKIRSQVFVMEEEYRTERQSSTMHGRSNSTVGSAVPPTAGPSSVEPTDHETTGESDTPLESADASTPNAREPSPGAIVSKPMLTITSNSSDNKTSLPVESPTAENLQSPSATSYTQFQHKRLCERWLDNLFMVLYEDLRMYTIWRTEAAQYRQQKMMYRKTAEEWEILGELAERLHQPNEALEAWESYLDSRFSPKAMCGIMRMYERRKEAKGMLDALIRLIAWQYRWYSEFSPHLLYLMRILIEEQGAVKVRSIIQATSLPQHVLDLTHQYSEICTTFKSSGSDA